MKQLLKLLFFITILLPLFISVAPICARAEHSSGGSANPDPGALDPQNPFNSPQWKKIENDTSLKPIPANARAHDQEQRPGSPDGTKVRTKSPSTPLTKAPRPPYCSAQKLNKSASKLSKIIPKGTRLDDPKVKEVVQDAINQGNRIVVYLDSGFWEHTWHEDIVSLGLDDSGKVKILKQFGIHPRLWGGAKSREEYVEKLNSSGLSSWSIDAIASASGPDVVSLNGLANAKDKIDRENTISDSIPFLNGYGALGNNCWTTAESTWNEWVK